MSRHGSSTLVFDDGVVIGTVASLGITSDGLTQLDDIFFSSSATQEFDSAEMREAFRERWLGRYLEHDPEWFYLACVDGAVVGYLAGCIEDPASAVRFSDIGYFQVWAGYIASYPAHLHVNVSPRVRDQGLGSRLICRFVGDLSAAGVKGVHLVTGLHSRNVAFYQRNGFVPVADMEWNGSEIVMLGRLLS